MPLTTLGQSFDCKGAHDLVDLLMEGPEETVLELELDPEEFIYDTMSGWRCGVDPYPPFRNGAPFVSFLECVWDDPLERPSEEDFKMAGKTFKKNLSSALECFPDSRAEFPISYQRTTRGEGIQIVLDETALNPVTGKQHNLILSHTYVQDRKTPLFWITKVGYGGEKVASFDNEDNSFCDDLNDLIDEADNNFDYFKEEYDSYYQKYSSSLILGDAQRCEVRASRKEYFNCRWAAYEDKTIVDDVETRLTSAIKSCLGSRITKSRISDSDKLFLTIGDEARITLGSRSRKGKQGNEHILTLRVSHPR